MIEDDRPNNGIANRQPSMGVCRGALLFRGQEAWMGTRLRKRRGRRPPTRIESDVGNE